MSEIIEKNKFYLVKSEFGSYPFNIRKTAEELNTHLNNYEKISKTYKETEEILVQVTKNIIQIQMDLSMLQEDMNKLKQELKT